MSEIIPLKTLFQNRMKEKTRQWRLSLLVDRKVLQQLLQQLDTQPLTAATITAEMPSEDMQVQLEVWDSSVQQTNHLQFVKHLKESGWNTTHVTLIRD